ncbi:uncharacterized protein BP01DRAFT_112480 [Aspergillus saccharolyticus JOP 1030-1]|uniref:Uncharacterized protein n=1 Tax=Aspergillus saccharolyticus JOP 1030-1 TaxID=1450539 RepID=A0A319AQX3_9EURO|nr:hypothetical protein BP01DRAFT_112480 [Aspergillus saccharolyticus JOP 1030-1]PYH48782.1 hypothetical protein BP01DRAFT_112480 [Aspergillus saccharolyticus JOP 1030-1]
MAYVSEVAGFWVCFGLRCSAFVERMHGCLSADCVFWLRFPACCSAQSAGCPLLLFDILEWMVFSLCLGCYSLLVSRRFWFRGYCSFGGRFWM